MAADSEQEETGSRELARAAGELYAVPLPDFVTTRTRQARQARAEKDRERARQLQAMRKPTVSASLVNQVVRHHPAAVARLRELGAQLRHAQAALDAAALSQLRGERDAALAELQQAASEVAEQSGQPMTAAVAAEVRETGVAALADAAAEEAAWSGTLTRALSYSGFGEVDVSDAVVRTGTGTVLRRLEGGTGNGDEEAAQERDLDRLRGAVEELAEQREALASRVESARDRLTEREAEVAEAEAALSEARARHEAATAAREAAAAELAGLEREEQDLRARQEAAGSGGRGQ